MLESTAPARICTLDNGFSRESRALLYEVYRQEPIYASLFEAHRPGYERRLRAMIRLFVRQHFYLQLPAIGLLVDDRLVAVALIVPPRRRLGVTDSWAWRLRMLMWAGRRCTRRYLDYQAALAGCLPSEQVHVIPMLGVHPQFQNQDYAEQLLQAVHDWCAEDANTQGVVLDTVNERYLSFYERQGYQEIGEVAVGTVRERVFFHPDPTSEHRETT
ncbi:GNAT family N-acetyltransferase [Pseudomonas capeferrum]|uniref:GNAT family N-acetyltransferase n=1 Tax=Pseudomonas capeferrum TaxID=1495066 RepID=UPI0015E353B0|nr:GNAT family N-acetyltransferase [Pseudomonas capeferrum]MBA1205008.1 GNAT family N-acetyltransferase [Pseudomonas capeferrum]